MQNINLYEVSQLEFHSSDLNEDITIEWFLIKLLSKLWELESCFSGKRPLGNSGWKQDMKKAMIINGYVDGKLDEDGYIEKIDNQIFNSIIQELIHRLGYDG